MTLRQRIDQTIRTLYKKVFKEGRSDLLPGLISGPYIQHNPLFPNGYEPLGLSQAGRQHSVRGQAGSHRWKPGVGPRAVPELGRQGARRRRHFPFQ